MFDIERVRTSWQNEVQAINAIVETINDQTATEAIRGDGWTAQDILGHVATSARGLVRFLEGRSSQSFDLHAFNVQQRERGREHRWGETLEYWRGVSTEVTAFLQESTSQIAGESAHLPWAPNVKTKGDTLRLLILHTRSHRQELEQGFPAVQA